MFEIATKKEIRELIKTIHKLFIENKSLYKNIDKYFEECIKLMDYRYDYFSKDIETMPERLALSKKILCDNIKNSKLSIQTNNTYLFEKIDNLLNIIDTENG